MDTGAYLSSIAHRQVHYADIKHEKKMIAKFPQEEKEEMVLLFEREGVSKADSQKIADILDKNKNSFEITMIQKELGLDPEPPGTAMRDALFVGLSYLVAATVPLFPYFFTKGNQAIILSIGATLLALFAIGLMKGKFAALPYLRSGIEIMMVGGASGFGGYLLGNLLPKIFHAE